MVDLSIAMLVHQRVLFVIGDRVTGFVALTIEHIAEDVEYFPQGFSLHT